jgi:hypothetical protein
LCNAPISALIAVYFFPPQCRVAFWFEISPATVTVPKATINEQRELCLWENEVRPTKQRKITTPPAQSRRAQK